MEDDPSMIAYAMHYQYFQMGPWVQSFCWYMTHVPTHNAPSQSVLTNIPALLTGDSTICDIKSNNPQLVKSCGGAKTDEIFRMLDQNLFSDSTVHIGTNDCATKYAEDKIVGENDV